MRQCDQSTSNEKGAQYSSTSSTYNTRVDVGGREIEDFINLRRLLGWCCETIGNIDWCRRIKVLNATPISSLAPQVAQQPLD